jgi:hypothetical protein
MAALAWLKRFFLAEADATLEAEPDAPAEEPVEETQAHPPQPEPVPHADEPPELRAALDSALASLGQAHHRPFSRG